MVNLIVQKSSFTSQTETMNKLNQLDFTGTNIYCGLDVHLKNWRINIRDEDMELRDFSQNPDPFTLCNFLKKNYPGAAFLHSFFLFYLLAYVSCITLIVFLPLIFIPFGNISSIQNNTWNT